MRMDMESGSDSDLDDGPVLTKPPYEFQRRKIAYLKDSLNHRVSELNGKFSMDRKGMEIWFPQPSPCTCIAILVRVSENEADENWATLSMHSRGYFDLNYTRKFREREVCLGYILTLLNVVCKFNDIQTDFKILKTTDSLILTLSWRQAQCFHTY
jgi:hypothetical protein